MKDPREIAGREMVRVESEEQARPFAKKAMERIPCSGDPTHILEMNGESYRLAQSKRRSRRAQSDASFDETTST